MGGAPRGRERGRRGGEPARGRRGHLAAGHRQLEAAREAAIAGIKIHAIGVSGEIQPDVRVTRLTSSQWRLNEGASLELEAIIESSLSGPGRIRLFENGVEVEELSVDLPNWVLVARLVLLLFPTRRIQHWKKSEAF